MEPSARLGVHNIEDKILRGGSSLVAVAAATASIDANFEDDGGDGDFNSHHTNELSMLPRWMRRKKDREQEVRRWPKLSAPTGNGGKRSMMSTEGGSTDGARTSTTSTLGVSSGSSRRIANAHETLSAEESSRKEEQEGMAVLGKTSGAIFQSEEEHEGELAASRKDPTAKYLWLGYKDKEMEDGFMRYVTKDGKIPLLPLVFLIMFLQGIAMIAEFMSREEVSLVPVGIATTLCGLLGYIALKVTERSFAKFVAESNNFRQFLEAAQTSRLHQCADNSADNDSVSFGGGSSSALSGVTGGTGWGGDGGRNHASSRGPTAAGAGASSHSALGFSAEEHRCGSPTSTTVAGVSNSRKTSRYEASKLQTFARRFELVSFLPVYIIICFISSFSYPFSESCYSTLAAFNSGPVTETHEKLSCDHKVFIYGCMFLLLTSYVPIPRILYSTAGVALGIVLMFSLRETKPTEDNDRQLASHIMLQMCLNTYFIAIRTLNEYHHRKQFEVFLRVETGLEEMEVVQVEHAKFCDSIIPPALKPRLLGNKSVIDIASNAGCIIIDIPNFGRIRNATMLPGTSAMLLAKFQELLTSHCSQSVEGPGVYRAASLGDMFIGVCNLLCPCDFYLLETLAFATNVANSYAVVVRRVTSETMIPLRYGVGQGMTVGAVAGSALIHYDLLGENLLDTKRLVLQLKDNEVGLTEPALVTVMAQLDRLRAKVDILNRHRSQQQEQQLPPLSSGAQRIRGDITIAGSSTGSSVSVPRSLQTIATEEVSRLFSDRRWEGDEQMQPALSGPFSSIIGDNASSSFSMLFYCDKIQEISMYMARYQRSVKVVRQEAELARQARQQRHEQHQQNQQTLASSMTDRGSSITSMGEAGRSGFHVSYNLSTLGASTSMMGGGHPQGMNHHSQRQVGGENPMLPPTGKNPPHRSHRHQHITGGHQGVLMTPFGNVQHVQQRTGLQRAGKGGTSGVSGSESDDDANFELQRELDTENGEESPTIMPSSCFGFETKFNPPHEEDTFLAFRESEAITVTSGAMFYFAFCTVVLMIMHAQEVPDEFEDPETKSVWIGVVLIAVSIIIFLTLGIIIRRVFPQVNTNTVVKNRERDIKNRHYGGIFSDDIINSDDMEESVNCSKSGIDNAHRSSLLGEEASRSSKRGTPVASFSAEYDGNFRRSTIEGEGGSSTAGGGRGVPVAEDDDVDSHGTTAGRRRSRYCPRCTPLKRVLLYILYWIGPVLLMLGAVHLNQAPYFSLVTNDHEYIWLAWCTIFALIPFPPHWYFIVPFIETQHAVFFYTMTVGESGIIRTFTVVSSTIFAMVAIVISIRRATGLRQSFLTQQQMHQNANAILAESDRRLKIMKTVIPKFLLATAIKKGVNGVVYAHRDFVVVMLRFDDYFAGQETSAPETFKQSVHGGSIKSNTLEFGGGSSAGNFTEQGLRITAASPRKKPTKESTNSSQQMDAKEKLRAVHRSLKVGDQILQRLPKDSTITLGKAFGDTWLLLGGVKELDGSEKRDDLTVREATADACGLLRYVLSLEQPQTRISGCEADGPLVAAATVTTAPTAGISMKGSALLSLQSEHEHSMESGLDCAAGGRGLPMGNSSETSGAAVSGNNGSSSTGVAGTDLATFTEVGSPHEGGGLALPFIQPRPLGSSTSAVAAAGKLRGVTTTNTSRQRAMASVPPPCITMACVLDSSICVVLGGLYSTFEIGGAAVTTGRTLLDATPRGSKVSTERFFSYYSVLLEDQERFLKNSSSKQRCGVGGALVTLGGASSAGASSSSAAQLQQPLAVGAAEGSHTSSTMAVEQQQQQQQKDSSSSLTHPHARSSPGHSSAASSSALNATTSSTGGGGSRYQAVSEITFTGPTMWHLRSLGRQGIRTAKLQEQQSFDRMEETTK